MNIISGEIKNLRSLQTISPILAVIKMIATPKSSMEKVCEINVAKKID
jgi:hypothetical protein